MYKITITVAEEQKVLLERTFIVDEDSPLVQENPVIETVLSAAMDYEQQDASKLF